MPEGAAGMLSEVSGLRVHSTEQPTTQGTRIVAQRLTTWETEAPWGTGLAAQAKAAAMAIILAGAVHEGLRGLLLGELADAKDRLCQLELLLEGRY